MKGLGRRLCVTREMRVSWKVWAETPVLYLCCPDLSLNCPYAVYCCPYALTHNSSGKVKKGATSLSKTSRKTNLVVKGLLMALQCVNTMKHTNVQAAFSPEERFLVGWALTTERLLTSGCG